ncbi:hypothetical protein [Yoonia sp. 2307UL14-13]|uniref:hypothetical protein n=1 Tax=Yoonia sp. 2307UL14-13 TaxID=3126506 RepID=UPI00309BDC47
MHPQILSVVCIGLSMIPAVATADLILDKIETFFIGGGEVVLEGLPDEEITVRPGADPILVDPNGTFETGQMYVQNYQLADPENQLPILMWHGSALTGNTWETKPDGGAGWNRFFLDAGYDTYVSDAVERGRASWSRFPEIYTNPPFRRTKQEAWELFRFGPPNSWSGEGASVSEAYKGQQFPVDDFDQLVKSFVPRWVSNNAATTAAYDALIKRACPCIIIAHSQAGNFGYRAALNNPDLVRALVVIESVRAPDPAQADAAIVADIPHLVILGDYISDDPVWPRLVANSAMWRDAIRAAGGTFDWLDLPAEGITGNSHMMMMDKNSDTIAKLITDWIEAQNLND